MSNFELQIKQISDSLSLLNLPLISKYRLYTFVGSTAGAAPLTPLFNIQELQGRTLVIKSLRFDYYVEAEPFADIELTDGVTITQELLIRGARINRVFDEDTGMQIDMRINGAPIGIFGNNAGGLSYPADLNVDNVFYKHPEKIQEISIRLTGGLLNRPGPTGAVVAVTAKVTMECYII